MLLRFCWLCVVSLLFITNEKAQKPSPDKQQTLHYIDLLSKKSFRNFWVLSNIFVTKLQITCIFLVLYEYFEGTPSSIIHAFTSHKPPPGFRLFSDKQCWRWKWRFKHWLASWANGWCILDAACFGFSMSHMGDLFGECCWMTPNRKNRFAVSMLMKDSQRFLKIATRVIMKRN